MKKLYIGGLAALCVGFVLWIAGQSQSQTFTEDTLAREATQLKVVGESNSVRTTIGKLAALDGNGLTFFNVAITTLGDGNAFTIKAAVTTGKSIRLHALYGTMCAAGTLRIVESNYDGTIIAFTGQMEYADSAQVSIPFVANPNGCIKADANHPLILDSNAAIFRGYAIVSTD